MPSQTEPAEWPALAKAVRVRRRMLGIPTQSVAASRAGISQNTWQRLEAGKPISMTKLNAVALALDWEPGYPAAVLENGMSGRVEPLNITTTRAHTLTLTNDQLNTLRCVVGEALEQDIWAGSTDAPFLWDFHAKALEAFGR